MVKIEKTEAPGKITCDADYRKDPVFRRIYDDFHGKCYLCEFKTTSFRVEHIVPRDSNPEIAHDWDNLFLACPHCNEIKGKTYNNIIDCTKIDPEDVIDINYVAYPIAKPEFSSKVADSPLSEQIDQTVELLNKIFIEPTTSEKLCEAESLCDALYDEIDYFFDLIQNYRKAKGQRKEESYSIVINNFARNSVFAAFKRDIVRKRYYKMFGAELEK